MFFKNLKINTKFRFENDLKFYRKMTRFSAERFLKEYFVRQDQVVYIVGENEIEDLETIDRNSAWSLLRNESN